MDRIDNRGKRVCVTGAAGFIGTHIIRELLSRGYRVRATVRDKRDGAKVEHLRELARDAEFPLRLYSADALVDRSFDQAFAGCDYICHAAASVRLTTRDPQADIVDPALKGTQNALAAAHRAGTVKRYVQTSSIAAIYNNTPRPDHVYTENDWCADATLADFPYSLAKTLSEQAAWSFVEERSPAFDLVSINPAFVVGPVYTRSHLATSPTLLRDLITGKFPLCPQFSFGVVDVRDVADAHVNALEIPSAKGRYMVSNRQMWVLEIANALRAAFPDNRKIPKRNLPNFLMYLVALFDKRINFAFLRRNLGVASQFDSGKCTRELGVVYRPAEQAAVDCCRSMLDRGLV